MTDYKLLGRAPSLLAKRSLIFPISVVNGTGLPLFKHSAFKEYFLIWDKDVASPL